MCRLFRKEFFVCMCASVSFCVLIQTVVLIVKCKGITWPCNACGWYRLGAIAVYLSGNAKVNIGFLQTAQVLLG